MEVRTIVQQGPEFVLERIPSFMTKITEISLRATKQEFHQTALKLADSLTTTGFETNIKLYIKFLTNRKDVFS